MPAPNFKANGAYTSGTNAQSLAIPTHAINDILLAAILGANTGVPSQGQTNLTNNGWARVANTNTNIVGATTANVFLDLWWQRASSSAQTNVVVGDSGDHTLTLVMSFANCVTSGSPWSGPQVNVTNTSAVAQVTSYNVSTSDANTLVLTIIASPRDSAAAQINASPILVNGSGDTELTIRCDFGTASGDGSTVALLTHRKPTAGATANVRANTQTAQTAITWTGALKGLPDAFPYSFSIFT